MPSRPQPQPPEDLFARAARERQEREAPLAARMRPRTLDELLGQDHLVGPGRMLRRSIEADRIPSMILWGPPGSGKTTLARLVAAQARAHFAPVSAVTAGVADLRTIIAEARERRALAGERTILFIDEIHRWNKAQQDAVLPHVEDGTVTLIGATTENPSFEVIGPLLSRAHVYTLKPLAPEHLETIVRRALADRERGLGALGAEIEDEALRFLVDAAGGDARAALNALELAAESAEPGADGRRRITAALLEEVLQHRALRYDKSGDLHYDTISAFIKSLRGSDPDAAVYWLARMVESGEDPLFIVRRMVILAAEDVGLADPQALVVAVAAQQAVHFVGMPEGFYPMAEAAVYLATAPKSNRAGQAYLRALEDARAAPDEPVPLHLRNAVTGLMRSLGYGRGYRYAHDFEEHYVQQQHLPDRLAGRRYYEPSDQGFEREVRERMRRRGQLPGSEAGGGEDAT
ncbi:MAG TPA: replication-associated recombination protein A [Dehalococcoidia bacterium]